MAKLLDYVLNPTRLDYVLNPTRLDYVLNPTRPQGGPKARVFAAVLGITRNDWCHLHDQLLPGILNAPAIPRAATAS